MEKRSSDRWELNRAHSLEVCLDGRPASLVNLSRGGIQVLSPFLPPVSVSLSLTINRQVFDLDGRIIWSSPCVAIPGLNQLGVVFVSPPDPFLAALERMLVVF